MKSNTPIFMKIILFILAFVIIIPLSIAQAQPAGSSSKGWKAIAVGVLHSLGIKNDGTVWAWGNITTYRGEEGSETNLSALVPEQVAGLQNIVSVAGGQTHSLALSIDGTVWAWGGNHDGQLGDRTTDSRKTPIKIEELTDVVAIEADWTRSFAVKKDGTVWVWGGFYYIDSNGVIQNLKTPTKLSGFTDIVSVSSGYGSFVALKKDGTVWSYSGKAIPISGLEDIKQIAVGGQYSYGLKADGTVWYWGSNGEGAANGTEISDDSAPRMLNGVSEAASIQASAGGPLILKKDGTIWTSGENAGGQLGIGSFTSSEVPVQVVGLKKMTRIAAHGVGYRSMAIRVDGTLWSWGKGYSGDGTTGSRTTPVGIKSYEKEIIENDPIFIEVDGITLQMDQPPITLNNQTMVPLRAIFDALGAKTEWNAKTSTISASKGVHTVMLSIGNSSATVNGKIIKLDAPPVAVNGYTLVPVRLISSSLGATVEWVKNSKTVVIRSKP